MEKEFKKNDLVVFINETEIIGGQIIAVMEHSLWIKQANDFSKTHLVRKESAFHTHEELLEAFEESAKFVYEWEKEHHCHD